MSACRQRGSLNIAVCCSATVITMDAFKLVVSAIGAEIAEHPHLPSGQPTLVIDLMTTPLPPINAVHCDVR